MFSSGARTGGSVVRRRHGRAVALSRRGRVGRLCVGALVAQVIVLACVLGAGAPVASALDECGPGTYSPTDFPPCFQAPAGSYGTGGPQAVLCRLGTYQPNPGQSDCISAPIGSYVDMTGATTATACPAGTTTGMTGSTSIDDCVTASDLAALQLVGDSGVGPGRALADKATAIQTAVNAGPAQTATACAAISDYLGLVKAQTGKALSQTTAMTLKIDAMNLRAALGGCH